MFVYVVKYMFANRSYTHTEPKTSKTNCKSMSAQRVLCSVINVHIFIYIYIYIRVQILKQS